jgi:hypothetical protein
MERVIDQRKLDEPLTRDTCGVADRSVDADAIQSLHAASARAYCQAAPGT